MRLFPALLLLAAPLSAQSGGIVPPGTLWEKGFRAWDAGRYIEATDALRSLLVPGVARSWIDSVAVLTGERYETVELTPDGGRPIWSADGQTIAYESGLPAARVTRVVHRSAPTKVLARGGGEWRRALAERIAGGVDRPNHDESRTAGHQGGCHREGAADYRPRRVAADRRHLRRPTTHTLFVVVSRASDATRNDILRVTRNGRFLCGAGRSSRRPPASRACRWRSPVAGTWRTAVPSGNPVRLPVGIAGLRAAAALFASSTCRPTPSRRIEGRAAPSRPTARPWRGSRNRTVVQGDVGHRDAESRLQAAPVAGGDAATVWTGFRRIDAPALSPDGSRGSPSR